ncbi:hypothetical protein RM533_05435 [Croceicoccus sp. F390]|uniref:Secreted protein n=1 Tax=Croceicoccus esteveae TaxID=3075597 RepID=A0ABU2ZG97_9SPHN|nr:hypothetical protein [Croceicoccus sp. F390]MDT0575621.1 hypothetical protein [Croceicoccus sp. F390]
MTRLSKLSALTPLAVILSAATLPVMAAAPSSAHAQESTLPAASTLHFGAAEAVAVRNAHHADDTWQMPFAAAALDDAALQKVAGREDVNQLARADQVAGVSQNSVGDNVITGDAKIDGNAFQNMSGFSILNVNTGNNVAINAAMNVNVSINQQ